MTRAELPRASPNAHFLIGEVLSDHHVRRWWGGTGLSFAVHGAALIVLAYAATHPRQMVETADRVSTRLNLVFTPRPGTGGRGSGGPDAAAPARPARLIATQPLDVTPPRTIMEAVNPNVSVPIMTAEAVTIDMLPGALTPVDGTSPGKGFGPGAGGGRGSGIGARDGPGFGDAYEAGIGGVSNPQLVYEVKPLYSVDALRAKVQGIVVMEVVVRADGTIDPSRIRITRSLERGLDQQAEIAVTQWRFRPGMRLGQAVPVRVVIELTFTLR